MLLKKIRKNIDWILLTVFISVVYLGGWQAEVFGFLQRGILATGVFNASVDKKDISDQTPQLNFVLADINGEKIQLEDYKGKTVFINFWATWCPPCRAEMPGIKALYSQLNQKDDIVFITISEDVDKQKAVDYISKQSVQLPLFFPISKLPEGFSHQSIPATYVVSPEGHIVYEHEGMANYDNDTFKEFLEKL
ncbi:thiol-disulfide isomerase/thioredoxin [Catalinimonas alkaloidigena]|uniref:TlpA family protein disulfide reductase n=1 Tax=Catalinimonas alkaloidigena TaxID=1075417 RepID=UPI002407704C|nr:TlpA disulfide reductase family protein [Catalinimonas alkaloidigena]MDF9797009.1 thiol-disulfide isomerase/thioredoxin [Catalinimonas alkaloidigena]